MQTGWRHGAGIVTVLLAIVVRAKASCEPSPLPIAASADKLTPWCPCSLVVIFLVLAARLSCSSGDKRERRSRLRG